MSLDSYNECLKNEILTLIEVYDKELSLILNEESLTIVINLPIAPVKNLCENFTHVKLEIDCVQTYPNCGPSIRLSEYWGLDERNIEQLYCLLRSLIAKEISNSDSLIFRIIEATVNSIDHNTPQLKCAICLDDFNNPNDIFATPAHHFFHKLCIETYAVSQIKEYNLLVQEAKTNNQYISERDLPKLDMRCPICRAEELIFGYEPIGDMNAWVNVDGASELHLDSAEIVEYLRTLSLQVEKMRSAIIEKEKDKESIDSCENMGDNKSEKEDVSEINRRENSCIGGNNFIRKGINWHEAENKGFRGRKNKRGHNLYIERDNGSIRKSDEYLGGSNSYGGENNRYRGRYNGYDGRNYGYFDHGYTYPSEGWAKSDRINGGYKIENIGYVAENNGYDERYTEYKGYDNRNKGYIGDRGRNNGYDVQKNAYRGSNKTYTGGNNEYRERNNNYQIGNMGSTDINDGNNRQCILNKHLSNGKYHFQSKYDGHETKDNHSAIINGVEKTKEHLNRKNFKKRSVKNGGGETFTNGNNNCQQTKDEMNDSHKIREGVRPNNETVANNT